MKVKSIIIFLFLGFIHIAASAQVKIKITDLKDDFVLLSEFEQGVNYILDTIKVKKGKLVVPKQLLRDNIIYGVTIPSLEYERLEFIYEGNDFAITTTSGNLLGDVIVTGNKNTAVLYQDLKLNLPLLNQLIEIQNKADKQREDSLLNLIRYNRDQILNQNPDLVWTQVNKVDEGAKLPFFGNEAFKELMTQYAAFSNGKADFIDQIVVENDMLSSSKMLERRVNNLINHPDNYHSDSMIVYMDSLFSKVAVNKVLYHYILKLYYHRLNTFSDHELEKAMMHYWNNYLKDAATESIGVLEHWEFGKLMKMRAYTLIGEKARHFSVRDKDFNKVELSEMEGDKKILVFYNPDWKIHWEIIANWRDDFNESGLFNKGYRLIFINVKSDIVQWELAYINLYIEDLPQYLNRLNDPVINNFFDVDLKHPYPMTYLIDANGIVLDKYKRDILDYFHY